MDERFLVAHVRGKGLAIFTGCSHAGIVNVCRHAQELFPASPLYALVGGLHLVDPNEELIEETIAEIKNFGFRVIIPGHWHRLACSACIHQRFGQRCGRPLGRWHPAILLTTAHIWRNAYKPNEPQDLVDMG